MLEGDAGCCPACTRGKEPYYFLLQESERVAAVLGGAGLAREEEGEVGGWPQFPITLQD